MSRAGFSTYNISWGLNAILLQDFDMQVFLHFIYLRIQNQIDMITCFDLCVCS